MTKYLRLQYGVILHRHGTGSDVVLTQTA